MHPIAVFWLSDNAKTSCESTLIGKHCWTVVMWCWLILWVEMRLMHVEWKLLWNIRNRVLLLQTSNSVPWHPYRLYSAYTWYLYTIGCIVIFCKGRGNRGREDVSRFEYSEEKDLSIRIKLLMWLHTVNLREWWSRRNKVSHILFLYPLFMKIRSKRWTHLTTLVPLSENKSPIEQPNVPSYNITLTLPYPPIRHSCNIH